MTHPLALMADILDPLDPRWTPLPHQIAPPGDWLYWMLLAGRMSGKTDAGAYWLNDHVNGPPCMPNYPGGHHPVIIAPTLGDAAEACFKGPSGLKAHNPDTKLIQKLGGTYVIWPNGSEAKLFGASTPEDVERLRAGGNNCCCWAEELAAWRYLDETWHQMRLGLRQGERPRVVITTTPKNRKKIKALLVDPKAVVTKARMEDNPYIHPDVKAELLSKYEGTRIGRQELNAEILEDVEGALWTPELIERSRIDKVADPTGATQALENLRRIVVAVDPSWGTKGDECGIVVCGLGWDNRGYVLEDRSLRAAPAQWGEMVADAYRTWQADRILAETNFQAEQVRLVMQTTDPTLTFKEMRASRGKQQRAEPIVSLFEQGKVSFVGRFPELEEQLLTWVPGESDISPDRLDAMVWGLTELMLDPGTIPHSVSPAGRRKIAG